MSTAIHYDSKAILEALESPDTDAIRGAAFEAGDACLVDAIPLLSEHIKSKNVGIQEAAEYALRKIRGPQTIQKMLPHLHSEDSSLRNVAMDILREISCDDIPSLTELLRNPDPDIRIFMSDILGHSKSKSAVAPLCEALLKDPEVNVRYQAAMSLGNLAFPEAASALHQAMQDEEWVQFSVVEALTKIRDDSAINTLVQSLNSCSPLVASIIIDALGELKNIKAVPLLLKFIEQAPEVLRHKAVKAIVQILGADSLCLISEKEQGKFRGYLEEALQDEDEDLLHIALMGLSVMGKDSSSQAIMQLLERYARKSEHDVYQMATKVLAQIGYNEAFASFLTPENFVQARLACEACLHLDNADAVPKLQEIFWTLERDSQRLAAKYLSAYSEEKDAEFMLDILKKNVDEDITKSAIICLGNKLHYEEAQETIFSYLEHSYTDIKEAALEACIHLHTPALAEHFIQWLNEGEEEQRMMAVYALGAFGVQENYSAILRAMHDESAAVRQLAVEALTQPNAVILHEYLENLFKMLNDMAPEVRIAVIDVLGTSKDTTALPYLLNALNDDNEWVCIRAMEALTEFMPTEALEEALLPHIAKATPMITLKIIEIFSITGGEEAFKALLDMMQTDIVEIQQAASEAIAKIKAG